MMLEVAILDVRPTQSTAFEAAFRRAQAIIESMEGYISHELLHCMEKPDRYILLVRWERLEDHTMGFRKSSQYLEWKQALHHFYDPFPVVEHYSLVM